MTGATGTADTLAVGTTTTAEPEQLAAVTDSGSENSHIFDFVIPRGATGATGPKGEDADCPVCGENIFSAEGNYETGEPYVQFAATQLFPEMPEDISADGAEIKLAEKGVYLINFKTDYALGCYGGATAVLELNGTELPVSEMTMKTKDGNSVGLYLVRANAGSTLKIKLNDYEKLNSATFYVVITRYKIKADE